MEIQLKLPSFWCFFRQIIVVAYHFHPPINRVDSTQCGWTCIIMLNSWCVLGVSASDRRKETIYVQIFINYSVVQNRRMKHRIPTIRYTMGWEHKSPGATQLYNICWEQNYASKCWTHFYLYNRRLFQIIITVIKIHHRNHWS